MQKAKERSNRVALRGKKVAKRYNLAERKDILSNKFMKQRDTFNDDRNFIYY